MCHHAKLVDTEVVLTSTYDLYFRAKNKKNMYTPVNPSWVGVKGSTLHGHVSMMFQGRCHHAKLVGCLPSAVSSSGHVELTTTVWTSGVWVENLELSFKVRALCLEIYAVHKERMTLTLDSRKVPF